jgi:hypothetical protein
MDPNDKQLLIQVVDLIKAGENKQATKILAGLLAREPQLEQAWYLMGLALTDLEKKRFAFNHTLKLNPNNERAKQQLLKLEADTLPKAPPPITIEPPPPSEPTQEEVPVISTPWATGDQGEAEGEDQIELPEWAKDITPTDFEDSTEPSMEAGEAVWQWRDDDQYEPRSSVQEEEPDQPQEIEEEEEKPEEKKKRRGLFGRRKAKDEDDGEEEPKKSKRKTRKEKKAEKLAAKEDAEAEEDKSLRGELLEEGSKRRVRWRPRKGLINFLVFIIFCGALGGGAYYYQDSLIPLITQYAPTVIGLLTQEPSPTPDYTITPTFTEVFQPTMPPTWTPAVTEIGSHNFPTLPPVDVTPTITPTPIPLLSSVTSQMDQIEDQIMAIRELDDHASVDREILPSLKFKTYMETLAISLYEPEAAARQELVLRSLGFVANDFYPIEVMMNDLTAYVGGFFYPDQNKIYIPGNGLYDQEKYIYSYLYGIALLDENFNILTKFCQESIDQCLAESALVAGDIAFSQYLWQKTYLEDFNPYDSFNLADPEPIFEDYWVPPYFNAFRNFEVRYGYTFLSHLYEDNGWQTVNYTYRYPPTTSEQIMHPEKFDTRERRVVLQDPNLLTVLGEGWEQLERGTLGEWRTYLLLSVPDYPDAVRPEQEASAAAAGWGGDTYQVYANPESGETALAAHWNWDSADDTEEFYNAISLSQAGRFQSTEFDGPGEGTCWMVEGRGYSCIYQANRDVLWLFSTDLTSLENMKSSFGQFN